MQDHLPFRRTMRISRSEEDADSGGRGLSTDDGLAGTGSEAETFGR